jgi:hypothetical protein
MIFLSAGDESFVRGLLWPAPKGSGQASRKHRLSQKLVPKVEWGDHYNNLRLSSGLVSRAGVDEDGIARLERITFAVQHYLPFPMENGVNLAHALVIMLSAVLRDVDHMQCGDIVLGSL